MCCGDTGVAGGRQVLLSRPHALWVRAPQEELQWVGMATGRPGAVLHSFQQMTAAGGGWGGWETGGGAGTLGGLGDGRIWVAGGARRLGVLGGWVFGEAGAAGGAGWLSCLGG